MIGLTEHIEKYLAMGLALIPIRCHTKIPRVKWKRFIDQAPDETQIYDWFRIFPDANIAALMGRASGNVLAIDVDFRNGGEESMKNLELPATFTSRTGGGGYHFLYRSQATFQKKIGIFPGIDLIADGGYCVMPPSLHYSGSRYEIHQDLAIGPAPGWLADLLHSKRERDNSHPACAPLIPVGHRHDSITRSITKYATETFYFTHLWKRAYGLAVKCCEPSDEDPLTIGELFDICLWAWNKAHPHDRFPNRIAWKLLSGSARNRRDIPFGHIDAPILLLQPNIPKKHPNNPTSQSDSEPDIDTYIKTITGGKAT